MFLGIDGGGTKTALCLLTRDGEVAGALEVASTYYLSGEAGGGEGVGLVERVLVEGVAAVCAVAGIAPEQIERAFVGLTTYGEVSADVPALDAAPLRALGHDRYHCGSDAVCGWAGSLGGADGINVVAGTGSVSYGEHAGRKAHVGGWGHVFGDEGSGYWIATRALAVFSRMSDGRLPAGPLLEIIRDHLHLSSDLELLDVVFHRWAGARQPIAGLSRVVAQAARSGDDQAAGILADAGDELAQLVAAARHRLVVAAHESVAVSYSGGVFAAPEVLGAFTARLGVGGETYELREPQFSPVVGAALLAARQAGAPLDGPARSRLIAGAQGRS